MQSYYHLCKLWQGVPMSITYTTGEIHTIKHLGEVNGKQIVEFYTSETKCFFVGNDEHDVLSRLRSINDEITYKVGGLKTEAGLLVCAVYLD